MNKLPITKKKEKEAVFCRQNCDLYNLFKIAKNSKFQKKIQKLCIIKNPMNKKGLESPFTSIYQISEP